MIAEDFHDIWWESSEFAEQREAHSAPRSKSSPFKIAVADQFKNLTANLPEEGPLNDELEALRVAVVEAIVTTNYDSILEYVFPDFVRFSGQDELLFNDPQGVGEIYKIHGSASDPESIVITAEDFQRFEERDAYLAAKLLATFVEHPVIFLGYSISDANVRAILTSITSILETRNLGRLKDQLIFVNWDPDATTPSMTPSQFSIDGTAVPIQLVTLPDFLELFRVLGSLKRRIPARILRHLREQVYELALTSEPAATVVVTDLEPDTDNASVEFVIGVGVSQRLAQQGLVGLTRRDLLVDVLRDTLPKAQLPQIVQDVLPVVAKGRTHVPVFKYLRAAKQVDESGSLLPNSKTPAAVRSRARLGLTPLRPHSGYFKNRAERIKGEYGDFKSLVSDAPLSDALLAIPHFEPEEVDPRTLKEFLIDNMALLDEGKVNDATQWVKCVCFYDIVAYKNARPRAASTRRTRDRGEQAPTRRRSTSR